MGRFRKKPMSQSAPIQPKPAQLKPTQSNSSRDRWLIWTALISLYLIWGSTYLVMGISVRDDGFAVFQLNSIRFIVAGGLLFSILRSRGVTLPNRVQTRNAAIIGVMLVIGGNGLTTLALRMGAPSGLSATVIATTTLWAGLWGLIFGNRPRNLEWLGMGLGVIGVMVLTIDPKTGTNPAILVQLCAPMIWSLASIISQRLEMPRALMAASIEMFAGGVVALVISLILREPWQMPSANAWFAWVYLVVFGSLVGYGSYSYLLENVRPALATSYAYVNPVIALLLGAWLVGETISPKLILALPVILAGMALIAWAQNAPRTLGHAKSDQEAETT